MGTGEVEDTLLSILTVVFLCLYIGKILFIYFYKLGTYFTMSLIFITAMTGDKMSDRTIVNICFILVKYIISNDNSYNKYQFNTHNVKHF